MTQHLSDPTPFAGELLRPGEAGYDQARTVFNGAIDRRPALIARCTSTADVQAAVRWAGTQQGPDGGRLPVAVRGGGHAVSGNAVCEGGLVIDLSRMKALEVDVQRRTVRAQAGLTWGELDPAVQEHGLAVTGGRVTSTGVSGLTLGAGSGWLERKLGYTCDNLLGADVVTADGSLVRAGADGDPELLWGLCGGGGNFGVVTSFDLRLHPVGPIVTGGMLLFGRDRALEVLRLHRHLMATGSDDLGGAVAFVHAPPEPFVPADLQLRPVVAVIVVHTGTLEEAERELAPLRALGPRADVVQPMPYVAVQTLLEAANPPGRRQYWKAEVLPVWDDRLDEVLVAQTEDVPSPFSALILEPLGGAVARVAEDATALGQRSAQLQYHCLSQWLDPADDAVNLAWTQRFAAAVAPFAAAGVNLNFTSDAGTDRVRETFGDAKYARLVALKDRYDPTNLFRLNQNIAPTPVAYPPTPRTPVPSRERV